MDGQPPHDEGPGGPAPRSSRCRLSKHRQTLASDGREVKMNKYIYIYHTTPCCPRRAIRRDMLDPDGRVGVPPWRGDRLLARQMAAEEAAACSRPFGNPAPSSSPTQLPFPSTEARFATVAIGLQTLEAAEKPRSRIHVDQLRWASWLEPRVVHLAAPRRFPACTKRDRSLGVQHAHNLSSATCRNNVEICRSVLLRNACDGSRGDGRSWCRIYTAAAPERRFKPRTRSSAERECSGGGDGHEIVTSNFACRGMSEFVECIFTRQIPALPCLPGPVPSPGPKPSLAMTTASEI